MYCKWCGAELEDDAKFCPSCGYEVSRIEEVKVTPQPTVVVNENLKKPKNKVNKADYFAAQGFALSLITLFLTLSIIQTITGFIFLIGSMVYSILGCESAKNKGLAISGIVISFITGILLFIVQFIKNFLY